MTATIQRATRSSLITLLLTTAAATSVMARTAPGDDDAIIADPPLFIDVELSPNESDHADLARQILAGRDRGSEQTIFTLRFDSPLIRDRSGLPGVYERMLARRVVRAIDQATDGETIRLAIEGLPVEDEREVVADRWNNVYAEVIERLDAFVATKGIIVDDEATPLAGVIRRALPQTVKHADGRPILCRVNGTWRQVTGSVDDQRIVTVTARRTLVAGGTNHSVPSGVDDGPESDPVAEHGSSVSSPPPNTAGSAGRSSPTSGGGGAGAAGAASGGQAHVIEDDGLVETTGFGENDPDARRNRNAKRSLDNPDNDGGGENNGLYVLPGDGWSGPTPQPPPIGDPNSEGYDAKVIARWDVVPYQTFDADFEVGVVAFHMNGVERVDFAADGGSWTSVREMTLNPRTGVWEYNASLRAADFEDGPVELRAIVYPTVGIPRVLAGALTPENIESGEHSIILSANVNQTLPSLERFVSPTGSDTYGEGTADNPYRSIMKAARSIQDEQGSNADGGRIYLLPGDHNFGEYRSSLYTETDTRWLTIEPAPGSTKDEVRITSGSSGGLRTMLVHVRDVTIWRTSLSSTTGTQALIWIDDCILDAGDRTANIAFVNPSSWTGGIYLTDSTFRRVRFATLGSTLARNLTINQIGADAFRNPHLLVNCTVRNIDNSGLNEHSDVLQLHGTYENLIVYGLTAIESIDAQALFSRRNLSEPDDSFDNVAFVNYLVNTETNCGQWQQSSNHLLLWHFAYLGQPFMFRDDSNADDNGRYSHLRNVSIRNSVFQELMYDVAEGPDRESLADQCHFIRGETWGTRATSGDPLWANDAFRPDDQSPLTDRITTIVVPVDGTGRPIEAPGSIGPRQPSRPSQNDGI